MVMVSLLDRIKFARGNIVLEAQSKDEACHFVRNVCEWSIKFEQDILIFYPGCKQPYRVPTPVSTLSFGDFKIVTNLNVPGLFIGKIEIYTPEFLTALQKMMARSSERLALIRVSDNRQLVMSVGNSHHLQSTYLNPNVTLVREDYWNLSDLDDFNRLCRQELREDGSNTLEFTYRALTNQVRSLTNWSKFTTRYRLIFDGTEAYQQAEILNITPIESVLEKS